MAYDQKRLDELAKREDDLDDAEAQELVRLRSEVSLSEYDPSTLENEGDRVVELVDHSSTTLGELAADDSQPVSVRIDAQSAVDNPPPSSPVFQQEQADNVAALAPGNTDTKTTDKPATDAPKGDQKA